MDLNAQPSPPARRRGRPPRDAENAGNSRAHLLRCGLELLTEHGISALTIDAILQRSGLPKGSFYHQFASKEAFVATVVDDYARYFAGKLERHLHNRSRPALQRLSDFAEDACAGMARHDFRRGCLVGNLGQEAGQIDEVLRERLEAIFRDWETRLAACLGEAVGSGELAADTNCAALAHVFWVGWEGAILRARLTRSIRPIQLFLAHYLHTLPTRKDQSV